MKSEVHRIHLCIFFFYFYFFKKNIYNKVKKKHWHGIQSISFYILHIYYIQLSIHFSIHLREL